MAWPATVLAWARTHADPELRPSGFPLLAAAFVAAAAGVGVLVHSQGIPHWDLRRYAFREVGGVALGLALPLFLAGATLSLPLRNWSRAALAAGGVFCALGVAAFAWAYPFRWNTALDASPAVVVIYGVGLSYFVAAAADGLLRAYVEAREARLHAAQRHDDVSEAEVERDLLEAAERSRLTWGGVRTDGRILDVAATPAPALALGRTARFGVEASIPADGLGGDVGSLLAFRGAKSAAEESYDDSPLAALVALRRAQSARPPTPWERLRSWWRGLRG